MIHIVLINLKRHIEELKKACDDGCRVLAYCTWSYTDLLSWLNGYQKRYGFVYIDREEDENSGTLNRYKKDSYYWYKKVIETNGEEYRKQCFLFSLGGLRCITLQVII